MIEWYEAVVENALTRKPVAMTVRFDEFNLDVDMTHEGKPIELAASRPEAKDLLTDPDAPLKLAGYMIRSIADQAAIESGAGQNCVRLHFNH